MKTEIETLKEEIEVLERASNIMMENDYCFEPMINTLEEKKSRLATLTAPSIRDGVLGRYISIDGVVTDFLQYKKEEDNDGNWTFYHITIEGLLPTLAQWVPGAVRWEYATKDSVRLYDNEGCWMQDYCGTDIVIPAPPRDDWESVGGQL